MTIEILKFEIEATTYKSIVEANETILNPIIHRKASVQQPLLKRINQLSQLFQQNGVQINDAYEQIVMNNEQINESMKLCEQIIDVLSGIEMNTIQTYINAYHVLHHASFIITHN